MVPAGAPSTAAISATGRSWRWCRTSRARSSTDSRAKARSNASASAMWSASAASVEAGSRSSSGSTSRISRTFVRPLRRSCARQAFRLMRPIQASKLSLSRSASRWRQAETKVSCVASAASASEPRIASDVRYTASIRLRTTTSKAERMTCARSICLPREAGSRSVRRDRSLPSPVSMLDLRLRLHRVLAIRPRLVDRPHTPAMPDHIVPLEQFHAARRVLEGRIHRTPILSSSTAARVLAARGIRVADGRIYAKAEHLQKTGAFKIRGALNKMAALSDAERAAGVITLSAGNHAQGVALAAHEAGVHAVVVMPAGAVRSKVEACRGYGAEVILFGEQIGQAWARMDEVQAERGLPFVPPFDGPWVVAGQGTVGLEILDDLPDVDVVVAGIGGGALCTGTAAAIKETRPGVRVYGVEPVGSNALSLALERGEIVKIQPASVASSMSAIPSRYRCAIA